MTNLIDIYEAAGGVVNEDRSQVTIEPNKTKPFKIELLVIPTAVESGYDAPDEITFRVCLDEEWTFEDTPNGGVAHSHQYEASIKLPVSQVKIVKE